MPKVTKSAPSTTTWARTPKCLVACARSTISAILADGRRTNTPREGPSPSSSQLLRSMRSRAAVSSRLTDKVAIVWFQPAWEPVFENLFDRAHLPCNPRDPTKMAPSEPFSPLPKRKSVAVLVWKLLAASQNEVLVRHSYENSI